MQLHVNAGPDGDGFAGRMLQACPFALAADVTARACASTWLLNHSYDPGYRSDQILCGWITA